jgi:hypothetical protein
LQADNASRELLQEWAASSGDHGNFSRPSKNENAKKSERKLGWFQSKRGNLVKTQIS